MSLLVGALVFVPYVGAVGLWDPWETHYGEVAREMMARNDYVHPYWESSWFFSKPPLTMWMDVLGMAVVGTNRAPPGKLPLYTEWGMRMPFVLLGARRRWRCWPLALGRVVNRRVGLASTFVLATMPLFFLITRQAVTDTPFVAALIAAMACAIIGLFDTETRAPHRVVDGRSTSAAACRCWPRGCWASCLPAAILLGLRAALRRPLGRGPGWRAHWAYLTPAPACRQEVARGAGSRCRCSSPRCPGCGCSPASGCSSPSPGPGTR